MKKLIVIMLSILLFFAGCKSSGFIEVDTKTVNDKLENSDTFILYMGLSYCSACKIFRSVVKSSIEKENFDVFYLESQIAISSRPLFKVKKPSISSLLEFD